MYRELIVFVVLSSICTAQILTSIPYFPNQASSPIQAVAADQDGNIYIAGTTAGVIPLVKALQPKLGGGNCSIVSTSFTPCPNIFVAKFDPAGTKLIYSTYLGGDQSDSAAGIAVDSSGNAYVAGTTQPTPFSQSVGGANAFIKKLNPDGSALLFTRYIGGDTAANGIAVDADGDAFIVGSSIGTGFPSFNPLPVQPSVKTLYVTNDGGRTWRSLNNGLSATNINGLAVDPTSPATLYAATSTGLYKSTDAGAGWTHILPVASVADTVVIDPKHPATIYATYAYGSTNPLSRSTDAGATWTTISDNFPPPIVAPSFQPIAFAIDPSDSKVLWAIVFPGNIPTVIKSSDSGDHWQVVHRFSEDFIPNVSINPQKLLIDPHNSSRLYACCIDDPTVGVGGIYRSDDAGNTWVQGALGPHGGSAGILSPWLDPHDANILYGDWYYGLERSTDAGATWSAVALPSGLADHGYEPGGFAVDGSGTLYLLNDFGYLLKSSDSGASWSKVNGPWAPIASILAVDPINSSTLYIASGASALLGGAPPQHAFVAKLDASGDIQWATLLGGSGQDQARAVAVDVAGNAYVTGNTSSDDFPTMSPFQASRGKNYFPTTNAFVTKVSADGSKLLYSSFLGGTGIDSGNAIAVDPAGNAYVAGGTSDGVFPVVAPLPSRPMNSNAASFVAKVDPTGSKLLFSTLLTGSAGYPTSDQANAVAIDPQGRAMVGGVTGDITLPLVNPIQATFGLGSNFIALLSPFGDSLDFSTYLADLHDDINTLAFAPSYQLWIAANIGLERIDFQPPPSQPGVPQIFAVDNGASFIPGDVVAAGEIVTVLGQELAPVVQSATSQTLPRTMQGVSVSIGGVAAPLFYVSPGQINFQVPFESIPGPSTLIVQRGAQTSAIRNISIVETAPGVFPATHDVRGAPVVVHASDFSLVTEQKPAHPGEYLAAFCTGLGATQPAAPSGVPATVAAPIKASIFAELDSGGEITISYAGLAPGWVGLYQINFRLRENETAGQRQLLFAVGLGTSNQVPIWVD